MSTVLQFKSPDAAEADTQHSYHDGELVLYQRTELKNPKWQYRLHLPTGGYERKTTGKLDLADARKIAEARYQEVQWRSERGLSVQGVSFATAAKDLIAELKRKATDTRTGRKQLAGKLKLIENDLIPYFGERLVSSINRAEIDKYHAWYLERWDASHHTNVKVSYKAKLYSKAVEVTRNRNGSLVRKPGAHSQHYVEGLIRAVMDGAVKNGKVTAQELHPFERTTLPNKRRGVFTETEQVELLKRLEARISKGYKPNHVEARRVLWLWTRFMLLTGLRPGVEVTTLRYRDIEQRSKGNAVFSVIRVREGKTGPRAVVASAEVIDILAELRRHCPDATDDTIIWTKGNGTLTARLDGSFNRFIADEGLDVDADGQGRSAYSLRHSYITNKLHAGTNVSKLAKNCGNSVKMITEVYSHILHLDHAAELLK